MTKPMIYLDAAIAAILAHSATSPYATVETAVHDLRTLPTVTADPLGAEWMPIATAPKDGTEIVIWRDGWSVFPVASWGDYPENPVSDSAENDVWMGGWLFSKFLTLGEEEGFLGWDTDEMPTHWTHVPSTKPIPGPTDDDLDRAACGRG